MHYPAVQRILGVLLMVFSFTMLPPVVVSAITEDGASLPFIVAFGLILVAGFVMWLPVRDYRRDLRTRDGFFVVTAMWVALALSGALPFMLAKSPHMTLADAVFETMSGLTTTGATVIHGIDHLPPSILYYRQQLNWLGGMGIIVLAVAILPMLGIGGMQLYRAETPGPVKDAKLTPRIAETAKALWYIYLGLTVACALAYWLGGMTPFDAIGHSFSTLATGGFSTHDASMAYYNSPVLDMIGAVFMFLAGVNFALHFAAWRYRKLSAYLADPEFGFYLGVVIISVIIVSLELLNTGAVPPSEVLRHAIFQVMTFITNTGLASTDYYNWPSFLPVLLMFVSIIGGCAGSTAGGIKVVRFQLMLRQGYRELLRLIHPQAQFLVKLGNRAVDDQVTTAVWGFFATYMAVFAIILLVVMGTGLDQITAFSSVVMAMNNLGIAFGSVSTGFGNISDTAKWALSLAMLMGRLEVFTVLVLFTPAFWRR